MDSGRDVRHDDDYHPFLVIVPAYIARELEEQTWKLQSFLK